MPVPAPCSEDPLGTESAVAVKSETGEPGPAAVPGYFGKEQREGRKGWCWWERCSELGAPWESRTGKGGGLQPALPSCPQWGGLLMGWELGMGGCVPDPPSLRRRIPRMPT